MKPPLNYYGGKISLGEQIGNLLPPHRHYVEPFAGSLAVLLAKTPSVAETVNDIDGDLVAFWRVLRDNPEALIHAASMTPHSRQEHQESYSLDGCDEVEQARRIWVRLTQGRAGRLDKTGWRFSIAADRFVSLSGTLDIYVERMKTAAQRLRHVTIECRDALEIIELYGRHPDVCIYADPPYVGSTRSTGYRHEMRDDSAHEELAEALQACKASVVLSGYHSPLYERLYDEWNVRTFAAISDQGLTDRHRTEVIWSNRDIEPTDLFSQGETG